MNNPATNIEEFRSRKETFSPDIAAELLRYDIEQFGDNCKSILIYDGMYISELESGEYWTIVGRDEVLGTLEECEEFLFYDWYITECLPSGFIFSTEELTKLLEDWAEYQGLPYEAHCQCEWLQWFIEEWDKSKEAEDKEFWETTCA